MFTDDNRNEARERTLGFFREVVLGRRAESKDVDRYFEASAEARAAYAAPQGCMSFVDRKEEALSRYELAFDALTRSEVRALREYAREVAQECLSVVALVKEEPFEEWFEDFDGDALGVFYAECFPDVRDSGDFFRLIKAGYAAGGVPCAMSSSPPMRISVFVGPGPSTED